MIIEFEVLSEFLAHTCQLPYLTDVTKLREGHYSEKLKFRSKNGKYCMNK